MGLSRLAVSRTAQVDGVKVKMTVAKLAQAKNLVMALKLLELAPSPIDSTSYRVVAQSGIHFLLLWCIGNRGVFRSPFAKFALQGTAMNPQTPRGLANVATAIRQNAVYMLPLISGE